MAQVYSKKTICTDNFWRITSVMTNFSLSFVKSNQDWEK